MNVSKSIVGVRFGHLRVDSVIESDAETNCPIVCGCTCVKCGRSGLKVLTCDLTSYKIRCCPECDPNDLTGMVIGRLKVIKFSDVKGFRGSRQWECECFCGNRLLVSNHDLITGHKQSCGCMKRFQIKIGDRFNFLEVVGVTTIEVSGRNCVRAFDCLCHNCNKGNHILATGAQLVRGVIKSCGCLRKKYESREQQILGIKYSSMISRCYDVNSSNYKDYGAKGVYVCDEWKNSRDKFIQWGLKHGFTLGMTLERINGGVYKRNQDGPYAPWNCTFKSRKDQCRNRSTSHFITVDGVSRTIAEWAELTNLNYFTLYNVMWRHGEEALIDRIHTRLRTGGTNGIKN